MMQWNARPYDDVMKLYETYDHMMMQWHTRIFSQDYRTKDLYDDAMKHKTIPTELYLD